MHAGQWEATSAMARDNSVPCSLFDTPLSLENCALAGMVPHMFVCE